MSDEQRARRKKLDAFFEHPYASLRAWILDFVFRRFPRTPVWLVWTVAIMVVSGGLSLPIWGPRILEFASGQYEWFRLPRARGDRFAIVVARLADDDGRLTDRVVTALTDDFGDSVEVISVRITVAEPDSGSSEARLNEAEILGQDLLDRTGGDLLVWGVALRSEKLIDLYFLPKQSHTLSRGPQSYVLDQKFRLPLEFNSIIGPAIAAVAISAAAAAFEDPGHYVVPLLRSVAARLQPLVDHPPSSLARDDKARIVFSYALAMGAIGEQAADDDALARAIASYRDVLEIWPRERAPLEWAATQTNLGNALGILGTQRGDDLLLQQAIAAYREALTANTRAVAPFDWAVIENSLGIVLQTLGDRRGDEALLEQAVNACREALKEWTRERVPIAWAIGQNNLANALASLGGRRGDSALLERAVATYREALKELTREHMPRNWANTQYNLGTTLLALGAGPGGAASLEQAVVAFHEALRELTRERAPLDWAMTQANLGVALQTLGEGRGDKVLLGQAIAAYRGALTVFEEKGVTGYAENTRTSLASVVARLTELRKALH